MKKIYPDFDTNVNDQFVKVMNEANIHPQIPKYLAI